MERMKWGLPRKRVTLETLLVSRCHGTGVWNSWGLLGPREPAPHLGLNLESPLPLGSRTSYSKKQS